MKKILILLITTLLFDPAFSQLEGCTADIRVEVDIPYDYSNGPRVLEVIGVTIGPGFELDLSNEIANPTGLFGVLIVDITGSNVLISSDDLFYTSGYPGFAGLQTASMQITNLNCPNGCEISNIITNSNDVIQTEAPAGYGYGYYEGYTFTQTFTANSITFSWTVDVQSTNSRFWMEENDMSDFEIVCETINNCEEQIIGSVIAPDSGCELGGIDIVIFAPDGTSIIVTTSTDGTFIVPGGAFPCGSYTAAFTDPTQVPSCYSENGSTEPIVFEVDGIGNGDDGPNFIAISGIPTLSQWGIVYLILLLLTFGAIKIGMPTLLKNTSFSTLKK